MASNPQADPSLLRALRLAATKPRRRSTAHFSTVLSHSTNAASSPAPIALPAPRELRSCRLLLSLSKSVLEALREVSQARGERPGTTAALLLEEALKAVVLEEKEQV